MLAHRDTYNTYKCCMSVQDADVKLFHDLHDKFWTPAEEKYSNDDNQHFNHLKVHMWKLIIGIKQINDMLVNQHKVTVMAFAEKASEHFKITELQLLRCTFKKGKKKMNRASEEVGEGRQ